MKIIQCLHEVSFNVLHEDIQCLHRYLQCTSIEVSSRFIEDLQCLHRRSSMSSSLSSMSSWRHLQCLPIRHFKIPIWMSSSEDIEDTDMKTFNVFIGIFNVFIFTFNVFIFIFNVFIFIFNVFKISSMKTLNDTDEDIEDTSSLSSMILHRSIIQWYFIEVSFNDLHRRSSMILHEVSSMILRWRSSMSSSKYLQCLHRSIFNDTDRRSFNVFIEVSLNVLRSKIFNVFMKTWRYFIEDFNVFIFIFNVFIFIFNVFIGIFNVYRWRHWRYPMKYLQWYFDEDLKILRWRLQCLHEDIECLHRSSRHSRYLEVIEDKWWRLQCLHRYLQCLHRSIIECTDEDIEDKMKIIQCLHEDIECKDRSIFKSIDIFKTSSVSSMKTSRSLSSMSSSLSSMILHEDLQDTDL